MKWQPGMPARVINLDGLKMPKGKPPFVVGDLVKVNKVTPDGKRLHTSGHAGWFAAHRFEPL